jgi:hypothetical protein
MSAAAMSEPPQEGPGVARRGSFVQTLRAVLWSFFGVRRRADYARDSANLNPVHVILIGIGAAALFVFILIGIVRLVVHH